MPAERDIAAMLRGAEAICRRAGLRLTRLRRAVLALVAAAEHPLTAYAILGRLRPADPAATPASVYRSLDFLTEHGLVHRIESARAFVACAIPEHTHPSQLLVCRRCGTAVETEDRFVAEATAHLGRKLGFALDHSTMELTGLCAACRH